MPTYDKRLHGPEGWPSSSPCLCKAHLDHNRFARYPLRLLFEEKLKRVAGVWGTPHVAKRKLPLASS